MINLKTMSVNLGPCSHVISTEDITALQTLTSSRCEQFTKISEVSMIFYHGHHPVEMIIRHADIFGISGDVYHLQHRQWIDFLPRPQAKNVTSLLGYFMS